MITMWIIRQAQSWCVFMHTLHNGAWRAVVVKALRCASATCTSTKSMHSGIWRNESSSLALRAVFAVNHSSGLCEMRESLQIIVSLSLIVLFKYSSNRAPVRRSDLPHPQIQLGLETPTEAAGLQSSQRAHMICQLVSIPVKLHAELLHSLLAFRS